MMPAARQNDQIVGVDIHIVMVPSPGGPIPTPLPHPFMGILDSDLSTDVQIEGMAAAMVGSKASNTPPHIPTPPGTAFQKPPMDKGEVFMGSATVLIDGKPAARMGDMAMTCNDPTDLPIGTVIGTAATVLIGGPPSMAGQAASGETSSGSGGKGEKGDTQAQAEEPAKDYVEFELKDATGQPLKDAKYEIILPDGSRKTDTVGGDGKVREDEIPQGNAQIRLMGLYQPRWLKSVAAADEEVEMAVDLAVYEEGTKVTFEVYREFEEGSGNEIAKLDASSSDGVAKTGWAYSYEDADEGTRPRFVFHAVLDEHREVSGPLTVGDKLELDLKDTKGNALGNFPFVAFGLDGQEVEGVTDGSGHVELKGLAFGSCRYRLGDGAVVKKVE